MARKYDAVVFSNNMNFEILRCRPGYDRFQIWMMFLLYYRTWVRSLAMLVINWLTDTVTFSRLDWCDPGVWRCQLKTCWGLLLMLMLMMRIVLATVWCILGSWSLVIKPNFCSDFEHKVCSRFWCWSSGKIFKLEFGQYFAADVLQRLWSWILVVIWLGYFGKLNSTLGSVVPLAMFSFCANIPLYMEISVLLWFVSRHRKQPKMSF